MDDGRQIVNEVSMAPGWRAVYRMGDTVITRDVTAFALVEGREGPTHEGRNIVGMVKDRGRTVLADRVSGRGVRFFGYAAPGEDLERFRARHRDTSTRKSTPSAWFG